MQQETSSTAPLTRKAFIGGPREWLLFLAMLGVIWTAGNASAAYPTLEANPPASFAIAGVVFILALGALARARRKLMPWGSQARFLMWGSLVAFAAYSGAVVWYLVSFGNGMLDRAPGGEVQYTILSVRSNNSDLFLRITPEADSSRGYRHVYPLNVSEEDWEASSRGMSVMVDVRPGFFGWPWVAGYRLCLPATGAC